MHFQDHWLSIKSPQKLQKFLRCWQKTESWLKGSSKVIIKWNWYGSQPGPKNGCVWVKYLRNVWIYWNWDSTWLNQVQFPTTSSAWYHNILLSMSSNSPYMHTNNNPKRSGYWTNQYQKECLRLPAFKK